MDLILRNGKIYTMDKDRSTVNTVCIKANKISKIGNDLEISKLINETPRL